MSVLQGGSVVRGGRALERDLFPDGAASREPAPVAAVAPAGVDRYHASNRYPSMSMLPGAWTLGSSSQTSVAPTATCQAFLNMSNRRLWIDP